MGLDCTFVNPNSKIDKDGTDEAYNFSSYDTIGNGNLRMIDSFPFAQYSGCAGFGETIRGLHGSTVAELNEWLSNLKTWILDNIGEQFGNYPLLTGEKIVFAIFPNRLIKDTTLHLFV